MRKRIRRMTFKPSADTFGDASRHDSWSVRDGIRPVCAVTNKTDGSAAERIVDGEVRRGAEFRSPAVTLLMRAHATRDCAVGVVTRQTCARSYTALTIW